MYLEAKQKYGWPYRIEDTETINVGNYSCPRCRASDRERLYALFVEPKLNLGVSDQVLNVLDFAPSPSFAVFMKRFSHICYRTADFNPGAADDVVDITDMRSYADAKFDALICSHVLEHVDDDRKAMRELFRVLKTGGWGIVMVPINLAATRIDEDPRITDIGERWRRFGQNDHLRLYTKAGFISRLIETGFSVQQYGVHHFGLRQFERCGITSQSILYVIAKSMMSA